MENSQEFMQEWEKTNNPFYPNEMRWDRISINRMLADYEAQKQVKNNLVLADVSGQLPSFLYEDRGEIITGVHGDTVVTDDWNKWKEGNLR